MVNETETSSERMMTPDQVITGEAVALEVATASVGLRILGGLLDCMVYGAGLIICVTTWSQAGPGSDPGASLAVVLTHLMLILVTWIVLIPLAVETLSRGRSPGRLVTGCRVVRDDGGAVTVRHSLVRVLVGTIEIWLFQGWPAACACVITKRGKRLGDLLAGTYVLRERTSAVQHHPLLMPPELAAWAGQADMRALPRHLPLVARTFLQRASTMTPASRTRLASQLAGAVAPYVWPHPPQGTHPERFLAAVLCERRDREFAIAHRDREIEAHDIHRLDQIPYGVRAPGAANSGQGRPLERRRGARAQPSPGAADPFTGS